MSAAYRFLPWVRQGLAAGIKTVDDLGAGLPGRAAVHVRTEVNGQAVDMQVLVSAPGDITGIDVDEIVRTDPPPLTQDFEPNYFPLVEFDRPDFPWLFTPASAAGLGRLRPWLALVVVREQDGVTLRVHKGRPLPVLRIAPPARPIDELPDLDEAWAWAHAQVVSAPDEDLAGLLGADSERNLARLVCPRRLDPDTRYRGYLVPAFETGRKAGLGDDVAETDPLAPAWVLDDALTTIELPVYFQWEFGTGERGDFESLVRRLESRPLPSDVGTRTMRVSDLGFGLPDLGVVRLGGVLRVPGTDTGDVPAPFEDAMTTLLNRPFAQVSDPNATPAGADPIVGPAVYGRFQTRTPSVPPAGALPAWLRELNVDPRFRASAAFGTSVVQDSQDELMHSAWQQLAGIEAIRQLRRQAQLSVEVGRAIHAKHFAKFSTDRIYQLAAPVRARVKLSPFTLQGTLNAHRVTPAATSSAFRRVTRTQGPLMRRLPSGTTPDARARLFLRLAGGAAPFPFVVYTQGMVGSRDVADQFARMEAAGRLRIFHPKLTVLRRLLPSAKALNDYLIEVAKVKRLILFHRNPSETERAFSDIRTTLLDRLDPGVTVPARLRHRQRMAGGAPAAAEDAADPDAPMPHPIFERPMYEPLRDIAQEMLLPGLARVPPETVTLAQTDPRVIESYMTGLNHEMSRELLWRRYPTDQRGTYFRKFWDTSGLPGADPGLMPPLHLWNGALSLGQNFAAGAGAGRLVLLIRGELLRRYPGAIIYAARPLQPPKLDPAEERHAIFRGTLEPDVSFVGFALTLAEVRANSGSAGWHFVLQQPPTDARFGMDVPDGFGEDAGPLSDPNKLTWGHVVESAEEFAALSHASARGRLDGTPVGPYSWGRNAAHMAAITLQRPVRIAIEASLILPPEDSAPDGGGTP